MITCPKCRLQNPDISKFCQGCGGRLVSSAPTPVVHQRQVEVKIDPDAILIKTIVCPHCKKDTLPDFDTCVNCGKSLTQLPGQSVPFQTPSKLNDLENKPVTEKKVQTEVDKPVSLKEDKTIFDQQWKIVTCPSCGQKTRANLGYCLNCKADLSGKPQSATPKEPEPKIKIESAPKVVNGAPTIESQPKPEKVESVKPVSSPAVPIPITEVSKPESPPSKRFRIIIPLILVLFILVMGLSGIFLVKIVKMSKKFGPLAKTEQPTEPMSAQPVNDTTAIYTVFILCAMRCCRKILSY